MVNQVRSYHPAMAAVHQHNAARLRQIVAAHGWPGRSLVGAEAASAAWRIVQHAIGEPAFRRAMLPVITAAAAAAELAPSEAAILDDRVRVFEGRLQRYGAVARRQPGAAQGSRGAARTARLSAMHDTSPEMQERYTALLRARSPRQRLETMVALTRAAQAMTRAGIRARHPAAPARELDARYAARVYGAAAAQRLFPDILLDGR